MTGETVSQAASKVLAALSPDTDPLDPPLYLIYPNRT